MVWLKFTTSVARACIFHTHAIWHIRHLLKTELVLTLAYSLILSRLDYCSAVLHGAPDIQKLQCIQNTAVRIVLQALRQSLSRPLLEQLHLLPVHPTHWLQARRPVLQDPIYINSCIPQWPHQTSGIYTPPVFFNHTAAAQTDYQNSLRRPQVSMLCCCHLELSEHWYFVL